MVPPKSRWPARLAAPGRPQTTAAADHGGRLHPVVVVLGALAGLGLRLWLLTTDLGRADVDESIVGLMARHAAEGNPSTFFYGQPYGGTQEQLLMTGVFSIFGSSTWALKLVPIALTAVAALLLWRVGRRTVGEPAAALAALLFWCWPGVFVWWSTKARGFYEVTVVLGLLVLLFSLRLAERRSVRDAVVLGAAAGCGVWASPQIAFFAVPAVIWLVVRDRSLLRLAPVVAAAGVVAGLPWLLWNLGHDWQSLQPLEGKQGYLKGVGDFFRGALPVALGLRRPYDTSFWPSAVGIVVVGALLLGFLWLVVRRPPGLGLLLVTAAAFPLIFPLTPFTFTQSLEPRYVWFIAPVVASLVAYALVRWRVPALGLLAAVVLSAEGLVWFVDWAEREPQGRQIAPTDIGPLVSALRDNDVSRLYAPYSIAYRVAFQSDERTIATPIEGLVTRYPRYERQVTSSRSPAWAFARNGNGERLFRTVLRRRGIDARRLPAAGYVVYLPDRKVVPSEVPELRGFGLGLE